METVQQQQQLYSPRILSVQSHVVSGYCGNKSATFPLQLLGFEVDVLNSVQLSNHTQYKVARGQIYTSKDLDEIHDGLEANNLLVSYDHILSGYVADASYVKSMAKLISSIKEQRSRCNRQCLYTFDPVLGDDGVGFYVPNSDGVAKAYKEHLLPVADIITPNRFEASHLSGLDIKADSPDSLASAMQAIAWFHNQGIPIVILTSFQLATQEDELTCIISQDPSKSRHRLPHLQGREELEAWMIRIPKLNCQFTGTGDLFAALISGWLLKTEFDLKKSFELAVNSIHHVLEDTLKTYQIINDNSALSRELRLVQNREKILSPICRLKAERIRT